jgi:hypothetical protein
MVYGHCISKGDAIRREAFFNPSESGERDGSKQEDGAVVFANEIGRRGLTRCLE